MNKIYIPIEEEDERAAMILLRVLQGFSCSASITIDDTGARFVKISAKNRKYQFKNTALLRDEAESSKAFARQNEESDFERACMGEWEKFMSFSNVQIDVNKKLETCYFPIYIAEYDIVFYKKAQTKNLNTLLSMPLFQNINSLFKALNRVDRRKIIAVLKWKRLVE